MPGKPPAAIADAELTTAASLFDCRDCGACCASFRVSFYWAEAEAFGLPEALVEQLSPWYACMAGTNVASPRCQALQGKVGHRVSCAVYRQRPSPCREVQPGDAQCGKARLAWRLPALVVPPTEEPPGLAVKAPPMLCSLPGATATERPAPLPKSSGETDVRQS